MSEAGEIITEAVPSGWDRFGPSHDPEAASRARRKRLRVVLIIVAAVLVVGGGTAAFAYNRMVGPHFHGDLHTLLVPMPEGVAHLDSLSHSDFSAEKGEGMSADLLAKLGFMQGASENWLLFGGDVSSVSIDLMQLGGRSKTTEWLDEFDREAPSARFITGRGEVSQVPGSHYYITPLEGTTAILTGAFTKNDIVAIVTVGSKSGQVTSLVPYMQQQYALLP